MKKLRILVTLLVTALALLSLASTPALAGGHGTRPPTTGSVTFTLDAQVLDGGQQVVSVTLDTSRLKVRGSSLTTSTFGVHARGTDPYGLDPATVFGTYDVDRTVTGVHLDRRGRIVIDLAYGFTTDGAFTFAWANDVGRNILLDLTYTITQNAPIMLKDGRSVTLASFSQGKLVDPEVDAYRYGRSAGLNYRLYTPAHSAGRRPLIVWLHGGGEGGWAKSQEDVLPLVANRGALGFSTAKAQRIFGGAYVLAPQATDYWLNDPAMGYSAALRKLIDSVVKKYRIDTSRISVVGASNGGYMSPQLAIDNPGYFAAVVPVAPVVEYGSTTMLTDDELATLRGTPTWIVQAKNDPVVPFDANGQHMAEVIDTAIFSAYDEVIWDGVTYNGHWSWIYVARNDPRTDAGRHLWQWMARQHLPHPGHTQR
ncbi:prolyl oligopeptidase family serine peptidase [Propionicimonas sp.]|uniref:prolyl oligopeptidase family serine peptidase n=1 Tax=Propionicimonas sp. TaxID=1955623 RepID=UPI0039E64783